MSNLQVFFLFFLFLVLSFIFIFLDPLLPSERPPPSTTRLYLEGDKVEECFRRDPFSLIRYLPNDNLHLSSLEMFY